MAQVDGDPLAGSYPFSQWEIGEAVHDIRRLDAEIAPRLLLVGVYDRLTGERLTALSPEGVPRQENAVQVTIDGSP
jgi:hypothetical protein